MKYINGILIIGILFFTNCKENNSSKELGKEKLEFNQRLANELKDMSEIDQIAAYIPQGKYKELSQLEWKIFKDSVFTANQKRIEKIFNKNGFPGYDLVGKEGSMNFWLIVQHSDHNPDFQKRVLDKMKIEVEKGNAKSSNYALLVDRVNKNQGDKQIYGTQVSYNMMTGQAYIKDLTDSLTVNKRRKKMGLDPLENYLNAMTQSHYEMNKEHYNQKGITEPKLYQLKSSKDNP